MVEPIKGMSERDTTGKREKKERTKELMKEKSKSVIIVFDAYKDTL
jgi:hypothetical protein